MLRICPLGSDVRWFRRGDDLLPIIDQGFLDTYKIGTVHGQCLVGKTVALWARTPNPDFIAFVASIQPEELRGTGPACVAYNDGCRVLLLWRYCNHPNYRDTSREIGSSYFRITSMALALDIREDMCAVRDAPRPPKNPGFVYVLRGDCDPLVYKIGRTKCMPSRIRALATLTPFTVELFHTIPTDYAKEAEAELHDLYKAWRVNGEWFKLPTPMAQLLCKRKGWNFWPEDEEEWEDDDVDTLTNMMIQAGPERTDE